MKKDEIIEKLNKLKIYKNGNGFNFGYYFNKTIDETIEFIRNVYGNEINTALKINKYIHNHCKDAPHDIGYKIMQLIKE